MALLISCSRNRAWQPAYFVVAHRGKNASARSSSARRRAISRRSQLRGSSLCSSP